MPNVSRKDNDLEEAIEILDIYFQEADGKAIEAYSSLPQSLRDFVDTEVERCFDPRYYLENYHVINSKTEGFKTLYPFWESQEIFLEKIHHKLVNGKAVKVVCLKARQLGLSTVSEGLLFWRTIFNHGYNSLVVAQNREQADYLFDMCRFAFDYLPWWMKPEPRYDAKGRYLIFDRTDPRIRMSNPGLRSQILVDYANKAGGIAGVGKTLMTCHISEYSSFSDPGILTEGIFPTLVSNALAIVESTARGRRNPFHTFWKSAVDGESEWIPVFIESFRIKDYFIPIERGDGFELSKDEALVREKIRVDTGVQVPEGHFKWIRTKKKEYMDVQGEEGEAMFHQEYPSCLTYGSRISTDIGIVKIGEAQWASKTESGPIETWTAQPISEIFHLKTKQGRLLSGTGHHRIATDHGWMRIDDLMSGHKIELRPPMFPESDFTTTWNTTPIATVSIPTTNDLALFAGYLLGDGCYSCGVVSIVCDGKDVDVQSEVERLMRSVIGRCTSRSKSRPDGSHRYVEFRVGSKGGLQLTVLRKLGLVSEEGNTTRVLRIPEFIWKSSISKAKLFLAALFECDGGVTQGVVRFYTKSLEFARDIQLMLLGFGINVSITKVTKQSGNGEDYVGYELYFSREASEVYMEKIGFRGERKKHKRKGRPTLGRPRAPMGMWDEVESITVSGEEVTYDLTIGNEEHAFSANGILTHNSNWQEAFQGSGLCAFNKKRLQLISQTLCCKPRWCGEIELEPNLKTPKLRLYPIKPNDQVPPAKDYGSRLRIWEQPLQGENYYVGADVALGVVGGDYSVAEVFKIGRRGEPDMQVAEWHGWISPTPFGNVTAALGYWYNEAQVCVECNEMGMKTDMQLFRILEYGNIFRWKHYDKIKNFLTDFLGWYTNSKTRDLIISHMREVIDDGTLLIFSEDLVEEMIDFSQEEIGSRFEGQKGHDDLVMASMICAFCSHDSDYGQQAAASTRITPEQKKGEDYANTDFSPAYDLKRSATRTEDSLFMGNPQLAQVAAAGKVLPNQLGSINDFDLYEAVDSGSSGQVSLGDLWKLI